jgi:hypothetical protein
MFLLFEKPTSQMSPSGNKMEEIEEYKQAVAILNQLELCVGDNSLDKLCAGNNSLEKVCCISVVTLFLISRENEGTTRSDKID